MATAYAYNGYIRTFSNGVTTFDTANPGVHQKTGSVNGPTPIPHIVTNEAGAIIDLDGTGPAPVAPGLVTAEFIFTASNPNGHTQYQNLVKLLGAHGTLTMGVGQAASVLVLTVAARLIEMTGSWQGANRLGTESWLTPVRVTWQLKELLST